MTKYKVNGIKYDSENRLIIDVDEITDDNNSDDNVNDDDSTQYPDDGLTNWEIGNDGNVFFPHRRTSNGARVLTVDMDTDRVRANWKDQNIIFTLYQKFAGLQVKLVLFNPGDKTLQKNQEIKDYYYNTKVAVINLVDTNGLSKFSSPGIYKFNIVKNLRDRGLSMGACFEYSADYPRDCIVVTKAGDFSKNKSGYIRLLSGIDGDWIRRED
ncbi:MAG: hypothetical protein JW737_01160 [Acidobacteria bacterium]|nr:hypothetical protein [Acidobacteriota bacterium]